MDTKYNWAHEEEISYSVRINWSHPKTHDMLNSGLAESDHEAYFYALIALFDGMWWPFYFGMVYSQNVSNRHKNVDHKRRLEKLKELYPEKTWHLTLGTPKFEGVRTTEKIIREVEGLLIYSNWHDENINKSKINSFSSTNSIKIINEGFTDPFYSINAYGVFNSYEE